MGYGIPDFLKLLFPKPTESSWSEYYLVVFILMLSHIDLSVLLPILSKILKTDIETKKTKTMAELLKQYM